MNIHSSCSSTSTHSTVYTIKSDDENIAQLIDKHFDVKFQNISKIEEAQVILLGDHHGDQHYRTINSMLIKQLYQPQDIVLVEAPQEYCSFSRQITKFETGINISGWDHPNRISDTSLFTMRFQKFLALAEDIRLDDWLNWIGEVIKLYPQNREMEEAYYLQQIQTDFGHYTKKERPVIAKAILSSIAIEWADYLFNYIGSTFVQRNLHMVDQINAHYFTDRKVFVIAGRHHLFEPEDTKLDQRRIDGIEKLHSGLAGKKFLILTAKQTPIPSPPASNFDLLKSYWQKSNWQDRTKIVAGGLGIGLISLVALPIIGVGVLIRKFQPFIPSDLDDGDTDVRPLIAKYALLGFHYYQNSKEMKIGDVISSKYNQEIDQSERIVRKNVEEAYEESRRPKSKLLSLIGII